MVYEPRICLINPPPQHRIERWDTVDYPRLRLGYLAEYLKRRKYEARLIDGKYERIDISEIKHRLSLRKPDIIGITAMTHEIDRL